MSIDPRELNQLIDQLLQLEDERTEIGKDALKKLVCWFETSASRLFKDWDALSSHVVNPPSRARLKEARRTLRAVLTKLVTEDFDLDVYAEKYDLIVGLILAVHTVTRFNTEAAVNYLLPHRQAAHARKKRGESAQEFGLLAAIKCGFGDGPCAHPSKSAASILKNVNEDLKSNSLSAVKVDVIRRRLEKRPRA